MPPMRKVKKDWQTGLISVGKGCYGYIQTGGLNISNAGLVVGTDSCLVIDTLYVKPMAQTFQRAIRRVTKKPIGQIVYTHHHADHTLGSNFFPKKIPAIAHRYMRERMEALTKMGPLSKVMEMVPGMSGMKKDQMNETQDRLEKFKVLMNSMTKEELENPKIIKRSRINRIAKGSGSDPQEIRELLKQYNQSRKMMSNLGGNRRMQQRMMKQFGKGDLKL